MSRGRGPAEDRMQPPLREGEYVSPNVIGGGSMFDGGEQPSTVVQVPTILMRTLLDNARRSNLPLLLPAETEAKLNPSGVHSISLMREVMEPERRGHWIRAHVMLSLVDRPTDAYAVWLDFDGATIGKLLDAHARRSEDVGARDPFHVPYGKQGRPAVPDKPRWVGSHAFERVFDRTCLLAQRDPVEFGQTLTPVMQVMATTEASLLGEAHVLCIDPAQVEVLPQWESPQEVYDFAADLTLPFEPLFLDFTGPGGIAPMVEFVVGNPMRVRGALVWRQSMVDHGDVLIVAPYAWPEEMPETFALNDNVTEWQSCGWFVFNALPVRPEGPAGEPVRLGAVKLYIGQSQLYAEPVTCWGNMAAEIAEEQAILPGYAALPFSAASASSAADDDPEVVVDTISMWGVMSWRAARLALAALSILEAVEVEFVDAPMEKRDRKRAVKRGWQIAQTVAIRSHSKRYAATAAKGEEAHYSHRFWRRATTAHYPLGTRIADARPDLVTPCSRMGAANCGFCRKVKRPAHIVGPEDKPLVLKTLVTRPRAE